MGRRSANIGERNPRAVISDEDVDLMRELYESETDLREAERHTDPNKRTHYWTIRRLMEKFELSRRQVLNIVGYHQRAQREEFD